eukprot:CAMPEP_0197518768 /NCGR_PEP_ID=MMETSP1318-20131121/4009_1 /TAXON_ID=552666 /ORGANISM="Partenskyella glossopodia, Strain RCC365" /LENGTH=145 /DNA_ID=CAMNT_0043069367 /DNA_START=108 /DNA_END=545 /DNA_ORIENTATION=+
MALQVKKGLKSENRKSKTDTELKTETETETETAKAREMPELEACAYGTRAVAKVEKGYRGEGKLVAGNKNEGDDVFSSRNKVSSYKLVGNESKCNNKSGTSDDNTGGMRCSQVAAAAAQSAAVVSLEGISEDAVFSSTIGTLPSL